MRIEVFSGAETYNSMVRAPTWKCHNNNKTKPHDTPKPNPTTHQNQTHNTQNQTPPTLKKPPTQINPKKLFAFRDMYMYTKKTVSFSYIVSL
ncbi:hypothetical protein [Candidatus Uabimicrobium amorphum]|uniref:Uncharacterized protein n=1 Tax=Uabimicrobium amorphum TaxID=2596890 RepID=A0A5S9F6W5_UABAM|nr:hypothetical protein UABAM_06716 [Candidatus Uabimicrobium amorphum]